MCAQNADDLRNNFFHFPRKPILVQSNISCRKIKTFLKHIAKMYHDIFFYSPFLYKGLVIITVNISMIYFYCIEVCTSQINNQKSQ